MPVASSTARPGRPAAAPCRRALIAASIGLAPVLASAQQVPGGPPSGPAPLSTSAAPAPTGSDPNTTSAAPVGRNRTPLDWSLSIEAPEPLDRLLDTYLDLARYQREWRDSRAAARPSGAASAAPDGSAVPDTAPASAAAPARTPPLITRGELRRLVAAAPQQVRQLLQTEGYFSPDIQASVDNGPPTQVRIRVQPGPRARIQDVTMLFEGDLEVAYERQEPRAVETQADARRRWGLPPGSPFRQEDWTAAKNATMARLRAQGYPTAAWSGTSAAVDAPTQSVQLFLVADSGPLFHFGPVRVEGLRYVPESAVRHLQPFRSGEIYSDQAVFDYQERLQKLGVFDNVSVAIDPDPAKAAAAPVTVQLHELPRRQATVGVGVSANTGPRVSLEYLDRQVFHVDWMGKGTLEVGQQRTNLQADFTSYPLEGRRRNLVSGAITQLEAAGTETDSQRLRVGRARDGERLEHTVYVEWQHATVRDAGVVSEASSVTLNYEWVWRRLDSLLLPTRGWATSIEVGGGRSFGATAGSGLFTRELGRFLGYLPLPGDWYLSTRLEAGAVQADGDVGVPDPLLFRAGGDDSVRGYGYRSLGPTLDGTAIGGRALATGSVELARPISKRLSAWWLAGFIDAGDAARNFRDLDAKLGYGVGVRWRSPVGPLKLDLAYGQETRKVRMHFSVGITF